jgi:hypothetical protein
MHSSTAISSYTYRLSCHHQAANTYIAKTYSNKIYYHCLSISNVQIVVRIYSV